MILPEFDYYYIGRENRMFGSNLILLFVVQIEYSFLHDPLFKD
jgi:hypothetical protein